MTEVSERHRKSRVALVLAGGAARGAYEVGVVQHILENVSATLGRDVPIDILCGTSVGALNACFLAAHADQPRGRGAALVNTWQSLKMADVIHPDPRALFDFLRGLVGKPPPIDPHASRRGGILDPAGLERLVDRVIAFERIPEQLAKGTLQALTVSTTHVGSGRTVVFVARAGGNIPYWGNDPTVEARGVMIGREHALASASIPFLFPAVRIDGQFYCDGGLRQNVPLSPARRLGADGLIVVSPRYVERANPLSEALEEKREEAFPGPLFLLGKALNALLLDRVDNDLDRLERINSLLLAGTRRYGSEFLANINEELGYPPGELRTRPLSAVLIRSSVDIGAMAGAYVRSPEFSRRTSGLVAGVMRRLADLAQDADLLSYLLFDGEFAARLIEVGRRDAALRHQELCAFFESMAQPSVQPSEPTG